MTGTIATTIVLVDSGGDDRAVLATRQSPANDSDTSGMSQQDTS